MEKNLAEKNIRKKPSNYHPMLVDTRDAEFNQVPGVGHYRLEFQEIGAKVPSEPIFNIRFISQNFQSRWKNENFHKIHGYNQTFAPIDQL